MFGGRECCNALNGYDILIRSVDIEDVMEALHVPCPRQGSKSQILGLGRGPGRVLESARLGDQLLAMSRWHGQGHQFLDGGDTRKMRGNRRP